MYIRSYYLGICYISGGCCWKTSPSNNQHGLKMTIQLVEHVSAHLYNTT